MFNPSPADGWCSYTVYPYDCFFDEEIECVRGSVGAMHIVNITVLTFMLTSLLCVITCMIIIIIAACHNNVGVETINTTRNHRDHNRSNLFTRETLNILLVKQAILYMLAFLLTWFFPIITIVTQQNNDIFPVLQLIFGPLQGFFNALIYIYNKVYNIKRHDESITTCEALNLIFIHPRKMPEIYLSQLRKVQDHNDRAQTRRDEFVARTGNQNNDGDGSNEPAFPLSIRGEVSLIFDDISSLIIRKHEGDNADDHVAVSLQDDQSPSSVMPFSEFGEDCDSNDAEIIKDDSGTNFEVEKK